MPRVIFLQVGAGGVAEHTVTDLAPDGSAWDEVTEEVYPTVVLYGEGRSGELVPSQEAAVGPATTLAEDAAAGATTITVEDASDLVRWDDLVIGPNAKGQYEWITPDGVDTSTGELNLLRPLAYAYEGEGEEEDTPGAAVGSRTLSCTFDADEIGSPTRNCVLEWSYTRGGLPRLESTIVHLSRYCPRFSLSPAEVLSAEPRAERMAGSDQRLGLMIRRIWERRVLPSISRLMNPGSLVSGEAADEALMAAMREELCRTARDFDAAKDWGATYTDLIGSLADSLTDLDESGSVETTEKPRSRNAPRLLRAG